MIAVKLVKRSFLFLILSMIFSMVAVAADNSISCEGEALSLESAKTEPVRFKIFSGKSMQTADLAILGGEKAAFIRGAEVIAPRVDGFSMASDKHSVNLAVERLGQGHVRVSGNLRSFFLEDLVCRLE